MTSGSGRPDPTLAEFERWCNGAGRGGPTAGKHYRALDMIANFKKFKAAQATEENDNVEHTERSTDEN